MHATLSQLLIRLHHVERIGGPNLPPIRELTAADVVVTVAHTGAITVTDVPLTDDERAALISVFATIEERVVTTLGHQLGSAP